MQEMVLKQKVTLETLNKNVLRLEKKINFIETSLEDSLSLKEKVKKAIHNSRKRSPSEFKTQKEMERIFNDL